MGTILLLLLVTAFPVLAAKGQIAGMEQTDAAAKTVTIRWNRPQEAVQYEIYSSNAGKDSYSLKKNVYSRSNRVTTAVPVSGQAAARYYDLRIVAFDEDGAEVAQGELARCVTSPAKVTGITQKSLYTSRQMKLGWSRQEGASGYEVETYQYSTKEKRKFKVSSVYGTIPMYQNELYRIRVRGYVGLKTGNGTKRIYGPYGTLYTSLQPRLSFKGLTENSVTVRWKAVAGADSYAVFVSRFQKSGYKRVEITQSPTAVLENLKANTRYYVLVRVNKRVKGVLYRSPSTYVYPVRIDTKGNAADTDAGFVLGE